MEARELLINQLEAFPGKQWVNEYFDLMKKMLVELNIGPDDPRIALTLPSSGTLPLNIGGRYILNAMSDGSIQVTVPAPFDEKLVGGEAVVDFYTGKVNDAKSVLYDFHTVRDFPQIFYNACIDASIDQLKRTTRSNYRNRHVPLVYNFIMDPIIRKEILEELPG